MTVWSARAAGLAVFLYLGADKAPSLAAKEFLYLGAVEAPSLAAKEF